MLDAIKYRLLKLGKPKEYQDYLNVQRDRSKSKYNQASTNQLEIDRKEYLVNFLASLVDLKKVSNALVIGCRNTYELDLLEKRGVNTVVGVDLYSHDPRVKVMDMMKLKFESNSFDLTYCSHALEHALDVQKAVDEMARVSKNGAHILIEVPIHYQIRGSDLHDLGTYQTVVNNFEKNVHSASVTVVYGKDIVANTANNNLRTDVARVVLSLHKKV